MTLESAGIDLVVLETAHTTTTTTSSGSWWLDASAAMASGPESRDAEPC